MPASISLGLDTGGTYTDAVLYCDQKGVLAKAKALTTRSDLSIGIAAAAGLALQRAATDSALISLVSLSTTLATNALVEGQGGRVCLVMIGFSPQDLTRQGLGEAVDGGPVLFVPGGHDVHGRESELDLTGLEAEIERVAGTVQAFAVTGYFAVRNPAHEEAVRDRIHALTGMPVTCSHELSSRLGGPKRALTTVLNARLIGLIDRLMNATRAFLDNSGIVAPLMIVRGDGALISAETARVRPIETILSGPAASLVGARHLCGIDRAVVCDIGGTTTDIAILEGGRPRLDPQGALVGGHRTMVEAAAIRTFALGGDSEVRIEDDGLTGRLALGPRRVVPLALAATMHGAEIEAALSRQLRSEPPGRFDGRFALRTGLPASFATGLPERERRLLDGLTETPTPLDGLMSSPARRATLDRLVGRGLAHIVAFTPSDAMHVLGGQVSWSAQAAQLGAALLARRRDGAGNRLAQSPDALARMTVDRLVLASAHAVLETALAEDDDGMAGGLQGGGHARIVPATSPSVARALSRKPSIVRFSLSLDRPVIALGAAAPLYYPAIAEMLSTETVLHADGDVANAIGAVVGQVRIDADAFITSPDAGIFSVSGAGIGASVLFHDETAAFDHARGAISAHAEKLAYEAGAATVDVSFDETVTAPCVEGQRRFVEARIRATASGRPRLASGQLESGTD